MGWFNQLFSAKSQALAVPSPSTGFFDEDGQPVPLSLEGQNLRRVREQVRIAAVETAAIFGIPSNWMRYEVVTISDDERAYFQLQVLLRVWDEHLWSQSIAFEQQVLKIIREKDRHVGRAVRAVLWRVLPEAGCPYDELSDASAWTSEAVKSRALAYDRIRKEFAPVSEAVANAAVSANSITTETQPLTRPLLEGDSRFDEAKTGFAATEPMSLPKD